MASWTHVDHAAEPAESHRSVSLWVRCCGWPHRYSYMLLWRTSSAEWSCPDSWPCCEISGQWLPPCICCCLGIVLAQCSPPGNICTAEEIMPQISTDIMHMQLFLSDLYMATFFKRICCDCQCGKRPMDAFTFHESSFQTLPNNFYRNARQMAQQNNIRLFYTINTNTYKSLNKNTKFDRWFRKHLKFTVKKYQNGVSNCTWNYSESCLQVLIPDWLKTWNSHAQNWNH